MRFVGNLRGEQQRAEVNMYQQAVDQSARILIALSKAYTEDQQARIRQRQAEMMAEAMSLALADTGIAGDQARALRTAYSRRRRRGAVTAAWDARSPGLISDDDRRAADALLATAPPLAAEALEKLEVAIGSQVRAAAEALAAEPGCTEPSGARS